MAKKKLNELDPAAITLTRLLGHANPSTGKMNRGTVGDLVALLSGQTPVKTYTDIEDLLDNDNLSINYLAFVSEAGGDYGDPEVTAGWGLYLYNGPDADELSNYTLLASEEGTGGGGAVDSVNGQTGVVVLDAGDVGAEPTLAAASETVAGKAELATQAETNTGTDDARIVTPLKLANYTGITNKQLLVNSATALTDAASMDLTAIKHTLTTSSATRTFTISYTGDDITLIVTLNTTATVFTFPATALCISEGIASGDNTCSITAVSGDKIAIAIKKVGSAYYVVAKNFGQ